jgi:hypothetical protein
MLAHAECDAGGERSGKHERGLSRCPCETEQQRRGHRASDAGAIEHIEPARDECVRQRLREVVADGEVEPRVAGEEERPPRRGAAAPEQRGERKRPERDRTETDEKERRGDERRLRER